MDKKIIIGITIGTILLIIIIVTGLYLAGIIKFENASNKVIDDVVIDDVVIDDVETNGSEIPLNMVWTQQG